MNVARRLIDGILAAIKRTCRLAEFLVESRCCLSTNSIGASQRGGFSEEIAKGTTDKQLRRGLGGLVESLQQESERLAAA